MQVSPIMKILRIAPVGWELPDFKAGQFVTLHLPASAPRCASAQPEIEQLEPGATIKRAYSIASSSRSKEFIEFYITLVHSGALTPRLFNLNIGDQIGLGTKCVGMFTLDKVPAENNIVLVATGTGVAPYVSMLRSEALQRPGKIAVIHGAANSWDLGYSSELMLLQTITPKFSYIPTIINPQNEPVEWRGETRMVQDIWTSDSIEKKWGFRPAADNTHVFLCGNPRMVDAMCGALESDGFTENKPKQPGQIHVERW
jgi:ferredoxin/flavodoxin---NADP+ reductase